MSVTHKAGILLINAILEDLSLRSHSYDDLKKALADISTIVNRCMKDVTIGEKEDVIKIFKEKNLNA